MEHTKVMSIGSSLCAYYYSVLYIPNDGLVPEAVGILRNTPASYTGKTGVTQTDLHGSLFHRQRSHTCNLVPDRSEAQRTMPHVHEKIYTCF